MPQIVYLTISNLTRPTGGVMVQAAHVAALVRAGYDAKLSSTYAGGRPDWIDPAAPMFNGDRLSVRPGDILVLHDSIPPAILERLLSMPLRRVMFCQNHYFIDSMIGLNRRLADLPIDAFICVSEPVAAYLRDVHGVRDPVIIRPGIMQPPVPKRPKKLQVCYMPRKRLVEAGVVMFRLRAQHPALATTPFVSIHEMHPARVAETLAESAVFLSLSVDEGLGLPPLEAMRAGCLVVGYHGGGGLDYADDLNGIWFDGATPEGLVDLLAEALATLKRDPAAYADMVAAGERTAARYSLDAMTEDLIAFWEAFL